MVDSDPSEAAEQAGFVLEICVLGALNLAACLAVLLLRRQFTWWLAVGLQAAMLVAAVVEGLLTDPLGWISFSQLPLLTLILLGVLRLADAKLRRPVAEALI